MTLIVDGSLMKRKAPRILSLFTGGGGLDIGFHKAGFKAVACLEIDRHSCDSLKLNKPKYYPKSCKVFNFDITKTEPAELGIKDIDFMIGGPPCQSFSAAGRRAGGVTGINDTRGSLFWYYCKFLKFYKPKGFLFENVRGILQANHATDWEIIKKSFSDIGYQLYYRILDAADYGAPQHRERVILVGIRDDLSIPFLFPRPTNGPDSLAGIPFVTSGEALRDIDDPNEVVPHYGGKYGDLIPDIPPGMNYSFYTERMGHPKPLFAWRSKFSGFLYKLDPNGLSKTVVAHQGRYDGPFHWKGRKLNEVELKRIQGFPDDYKFSGSYVEIVKQIGNSVSPKISEALAKAVFVQLFHASENNESEIDLLPEDYKLKFDARKGLKAKKTSRLLKQNVNLRQLDLLKEDIEWPEYSLTDVIDYDNVIAGKFDRKMSLKNGTWDISVVKLKSNNVVNVHLTLDFCQPVGCSFNKITASLSSSLPYEITVIWDAIHAVVSNSSSYASLQPLYGHFTEPYPKFTLDMSFEAKSKRDCELLTFICDSSDFDNIGKILPVSNLKAIANGSAMEVIKSLRGHRYDIRVHETNRTIPEGHYKMCYPFTLPLNEKSYTVWKEIGEHATGDLQFQGDERGDIVPVKRRST